MPSGDGEITFSVIGKFSSDGVFLHRGVVWLNPQTNIMLARAHGYYLREVALYRVSGNQTKFLFSGTSDRSRVGEVIIHPHRNLGVTEFVL